MDETASAVTIRDAEVSDAPQIARVLVGMGWFSALQGMTLEEIERNVEGQLSSLTRSTSSTTLVAQAPDDSIVGYCNVHWLTALFLPGPEGYLSELFLLPEARGQGIGSELVERIIAEAESRGAHRLMLLNGKHRESYERGFYTKVGWEERESMANFVYRVDKA